MALVGFALICSGQSTQIVNDASGNAYAALNYSLEKFDPAGNLLWTALYRVQAAAVAVDASGNAYLAGGLGTYPLQATGSLGPCGLGSAFVAKFDPSGNMLYAACLPPSQAISSMAVDSTGSAYLVGTATSGISIGATPNALQPNLIGSQNAFVTKIDPTGNKVLYSTYFGGDGTTGSAIAVDGGGRAYIGGSTTAQRLATSNAMQGALAGAPLYRSSDQGQTWSPLGSGLPSKTTLAIAFDPSNTNLLYAIAGTYTPEGESFYRSTDGGSTWALVSAVPVYGADGGGCSLGVEGDGAVVLGICGISGPQLVNFLLRSTDQGAHWILENLPPTTGFLDVDAGSTSTQYVATDSLIYQTRDGGATWQTIFTPPKGTILNFLIDPHDSQKLYAQYDVALAQSSDGGMTWTSSNITAPPVPTYVTYDPFQDLLLSPASSSTIYSAYYGMYRSDDGGASWYSYNPEGPIVSGLTAPAFIKADPGDPNAVYEVSFTCDQLARVDGSATATVLGQSLSDQPVSAWGFSPAAPFDLYLAVPVASDGFVARINADGTAADYVTYIGGVGNDLVSAITLAADGTVFAAGTTWSYDFPVTQDAFQTIFHGGAGSTPMPTQSAAYCPGTDGFVARFDSSLSRLIYSTYLGGTGADLLTGIHIQPDSSFVVSGTSASRDFPYTAGGTPTGYFGATVTQFSPDGGNILYSIVVGDDSSPGGYYTSLSGAPSGSVWATGDPYIGIFQVPQMFGPVISTGGIVDVFAGLSGKAAPGSVLSIYGSGFANAQASPSGFPYPTQLGGVSVSVNGELAPLFYADANLINFQVPFDVALGRAQIVVESASGESIAGAVNVSACAPVVLVSNGQVVAERPDGSLVSSSNPVRAGDPVAIFLIGQGSVTNQPASGAPAPSSPLAEVPVPVQVTIGPMSFTAGFAGLVPGLVGLAQANFDVPSLAPGSYALTLTIAGQVSNSGLLTIVP